jgi:hypothetical protein
MNEKIKELADLVVSIAPMVAKMQFYSGSKYPVQDQNDCESAIERLAAAKADIGYVIDRMKDFERTRQPD